MAGLASVIRPSVIYHKKQSATNNNNYYTEKQTKNELLRKKWFVISFFPSESNTLPEKNKSFNGIRLLFNLEYVAA